MRGPVVRTCIEPTGSDKISVYYLKSLAVSIAGIPLGLRCAEEHRNCWQRHQSDVHIAKKLETSLPFFQTWRIKLSVNDFWSHDGNYIHQELRCGRTSRLLTKKPVRCAHQCIKSCPTKIRRPLNGHHSGVGCWPDPSTTNCDTNAKIQTKDARPKTSATKAQRINATRHNKTKQDTQQESLHNTL